ncbi:MAG: spore gernimation protein GerC [Bacillales bacterium]|jgi:spore germination protein KC|nr:spore gernimation protein GerC [Bacillales bacterium]
MRVVKISFLVLMILVTSFLVTGCWNYKEIDKMAIVSGVAVDKGKKEKIRLTVEIIQVSGGSNSVTSPKVITTEGKTIFDAARNAISIVGKKLYWSHVKVLIISKELAKKDVIPIMDWYKRDSETRFDVNLLISKGDCAAEILTGKILTDQIMSFELSNMIKNQKNLSKAPQSNMVVYCNQLEGEGIQPVLPTIELKKIANSKIPTIMGTGIFKADKVVGYIDGDETMNLLFVKDEVKGGVLVVDVKEKDKSTSVSLEIFKSKTEVKPIIDGKNIKMSIKIETETAIDEVTSDINIINQKGFEKVENLAEEKLKKQVTEVIKKVQHKYKADVFGFGSKVNQEDPKVWKKIEKDWDKKFENLEVSVDAKVHIRNSAELSRTLKVWK